MKDGSKIIKSNNTLECCSRETYNLINIVVKFDIMKKTSLVGYHGKGEWVEEELLRKMVNPGYKSYW